MKLLHFADLHLGVENYGRTDPATGLSSRLGDFLRTFDEVVDYAIRERVDAAAGPLQIVGLPWVTRSALLAREDYQAASMDEIARRLRESIVGALEQLAEEVREQPDAPAVLMGHLSLAGATFGSEQSIML